MKTLTAKSYKQQGFTPIELMIALTLGGLLSIGMIQVLISSKQVYKMQDNVSRLQENGRFALSFITRDIRDAGSKYCYYHMSDTSPNAVVNGYDNSTITNLFVGTSLTKTIYLNNPTYSGGNGSDVLALGQSINDPPNTPACDPNPPDAPPVAPINARVAYSIQIGPSGKPALYKTWGTMPQGSSNQEQVEGIEDMQVLYGPDIGSATSPTTPDGVPDYYVPSTTAGLSAVMNKVISIRVSLLVRSNDDNLISYAANGYPVPIYFNGANVTSWDKRLRRVFSTTVAIRNPRS